MIYNHKYNNYSDNEIINKYSENEDSALIGILYERYGHLVLGLALKYLKNKDEAKDAVIQIFSDLMNDLLKHKITFFKSWLYVYSKNHCLMLLRKRQSNLKKELELKENHDLFMDNEDPEHLNEKERQIEVMERAISLLNEDQKKCIELFYLQNKSYNEITALTGYSSNDVKSFIQNGKRNLKIKIESLINEQNKG